jgi:hypothetical protein
MLKFLPVVVALILMITGCASESHVLVGKPRPPISADQVTIYLHPPVSYEEIAIVDATSRNGFAFTDQQKMNTVIGRMKDEAASLGANGILLEGVGEQEAGSVGSGFGSSTVNGSSAHSTGLGVSAGVFHKIGKGLAIYVPPQG